MTSNGVSNIEDADMAECDGEKVVTMMDVLQEEQDFEDDANAVLGASDEKNCTYSKGYIKRQAIYACLTCCIEAKFDPTKRAGVCLACSLNCHENHELVELYTKRNFRCDCGNPKFNSHHCHFTPNKDDLNEDNNYNQNFSGLYCTCHRPYPDPESIIDDDEMIQCIICEDWLHTSHLDAAVPGIDQYSEMVCKACMEKNEFLHDYSHLAVNIECQNLDVSINVTETTLSNGETIIENLVNGTVNSSIDIIEKPCENMDADKVQTNSSIPEKLCENTDAGIVQTEGNSLSENDGSIVNLTSHKSVEECKENKSDVTMEAETTENMTQNSSDINTESKNDSNMDTTTKETLRPLEESTTVSEDKSKVTTNENSEKITKSPSEGTLEDIKMTPETTENISELQEPKEALLQSNEEAKDNQESEETKKEDLEQEVESKELEEKTELTENIDTNEITAENNQCEVSKHDSDTKQDEINITAEGTKISSENDNEINDSNKESPDQVNMDLPQDVSQTDSMETEKISCEIVSTQEMSETSSNVNTVDSCENENESKKIKRKLSTDETSAADTHLDKKPKMNEKMCVRPKEVKRVHKGATFWPANLRQNLCNCNECLAMYKDLSVLFLTDPEDTVFAYETLGKERVDGRATQYEKGLEALSSLDRIQQINALTEYNNMKDKLLDFLKSFKDRKEIVKEEDIKAFFAGMKPKREPDGVYFCR